MDREEKKWEHQTNKKLSLADHYGILQPIRNQDGSFSWKGIDITPAGNGHEIMVTAETLPPGTSIPILGTLIDLTYIPETEHPPPTTHTYQHDRRTGTTPYRIDGPPMTQEGENIACNGLAIAMKANEPEDTSTGSAIFKH